LRDYLKVYLPKTMLKEIEHDLIEFGDKVSGEYLRMSRLAELEPPVFEK